MRPPLLGRALLRLAAPEAEAECVAGDLEEEFRSVAQTRGRRACTYSTEETGMKWILRIVAALVALAGVAVMVLLILGHRDGAGRVHAAAEINGSPQQLWPWLTEPAKLKQWISWLVEIRTTEQTPRIGGKEVWVMRDENNGGQLMEIEGTLTEYAPPARLSVHTETRNEFTGDQTYRLADLGNGRTRLEIDGQYRFLPWFARLLEPVITPAAEKKLAGDAARLKSLVEGGAAH